MMAIYITMSRLPAGALTIKFVIHNEAGPMIFKISRYRVNFDFAHVMLNP